MIIKWPSENSLTYCSIKRPGLNLFFKNKYPLNLIIIFNFRSTLSILSMVIKKSQDELLYVSEKKS